MAIALETCAAAHVGHVLSLDSVPRLPESSHSPIPRWKLLKGTRPSNQDNFYWRYRTGTLNVLLTPPDILEHVNIAAWIVPSYKSIVSLPRKRNSAAVCRVKNEFAVCTILARQIQIVHGRNRCPSADFLHQRGNNGVIRRFDPERLLLLHRASRRSQKDEHRKRKRQPASHRHAPVIPR